jgi:hypothetical protein
VEVGGKLTLANLPARRKAHFRIIGEASYGEHRIVTLGGSRETLDKVCTVSNEVFGSLAVSEEKIHSSLAPSTGNLSKLGDLAILCLTNKSHGENIVLLKRIKNNTSVAN